MNRVAVLYTCGCWQRIRVDLARRSACEKHSDAHVTKVNTHEWRVRCPDCRYGRWCGEDESEARRLQRSHLMGHPTHYPSVAYDRVTYDGMGRVLRWDGSRPRPAPKTDMIPELIADGDDAPPF